MEILIIDSESSSDTLLERLQQELWNDIRWTRVRTVHAAVNALFPGKGKHAVRYTHGPNPIAIDIQKPPYGWTFINWNSKLDAMTNSGADVVFLSQGARLQAMRVLAYDPHLKPEKLWTLGEMTRGASDATADISNIPQLCHTLGLMIPPKHLPPFAHTPSISELSEETAQLQIARGMRPDIRDLFEHCLAQQESLSRYR